MSNRAALKLVGMSTLFVYLSLFTVSCIDATYGRVHFFLYENPRKYQETIPIVVGVDKFVETKTIRWLYSDCGRLYDLSPDPSFGEGFTQLFHEHLIKTELFKKVHKAPYMPTDVQLIMKPRIIEVRQTFPGEREWCGALIPAYIAFVIPGIIAHQFCAYEAHYEVSIAVQLWTSKGSFVAEYYAKSSEYDTLDCSYFPGKDSELKMLKQRPAAMKAASKAFLDITGEMQHDKPRILKALIKDGLLPPDLQSSIGRNVGFGRL